MRRFSELSKQTVPELWSRREEIFNDPSLDCEDLVIDSAGVAFLVKWSQSLGERQLHLIDASSDLKHLITVFRLEKLFLMEKKNG